jgi:hypothetical protein
MVLRIFVFSNFSKCFQFNGSVKNYAQISLQSPGERSSPQHKASSPADRLVAALRKGQAELTSHALP